MPGLAAVSPAELVYPLNLPGETAADARRHPTAAAVWHAGGGLLETTGGRKNLATNPGDFGLPSLISARVYWQLMR